MRRALIPAFALALLITGCNGPVLERIRGDENPHESTEPALPQSRPQSSAQSDQPLMVQATINANELSASDLEWLASAHGLYVESGDYWYDPISGAWGYWGGPTAGFIKPFLELGYAPLRASGGGTGVVLNGRELHPQDLSSLQQLLGPIYPGYYWLDASGDYGYEGGPAVGNLIYAAQGAGSSENGIYHDSTYFGNIGSDGQSSYFYDSSTGCSVMSDGGLSC